MAKRKLNKKLAIVGTFILAVAVIAAVLAGMRKLRGPEQYLKDGDAAYAAKNYKAALKAYGSAYGKAKTNPVRINALYKLVNVHKALNDWPAVLNAWGHIAALDSTDVPSREGRLDYFYEIAGYGQVSAWKVVDTSADELTKISPKPKYQAAKGRAMLEMARHGETSNRDKAISDAQAILNQAKKNDPKNGEIRWYLAEAEMIRGDIAGGKGFNAERDKAYKEAQVILEDARKAMPNDPNMYIHLLEVKLQDLIEKGKSTQQLAADFVALTKKFPKTAVVFSAASNFYSYDINSIDNAIECANKARQIDNQSVACAVSAARLMYFKGAIAKDQKMRSAAIKLAKDALSLPLATVTPGPKEWVAKNNILTINTFIADSYIDEILDLPSTAPKTTRDEMIAGTEQAVHEISQILASGENPFVLQIQGMLDYVKGNTDDGINKMYAAYQKLKPIDTENTDVQLGELSYVLARAYANSPETGAVYQFLINSISRHKYRSKPEALIEYANVAIALHDNEHALQAITVYEHMFKPTTETSLLRAHALITWVGQLDQAEAVLAKIKTVDAGVLQAKYSLLAARYDAAIGSSLQEKDPASKATIEAEAVKYLNGQTAIMEKLIAMDSNSVQMAAPLIERLISKGRMSEAKSLVDKVLAAKPKNYAAISYRKILLEKDPSAVTQERRREISRETAESIGDPFDKAVAMADLYRGSQEYDKALAELMKALDAKPDDAMVKSMLFDMALNAKDYKTAERVAAMAKRDNLDKCNGLLFAARLNVAKKEYRDAIDKIDAALKLRPISSGAYLVRSIVDVNLDDPAKALEDAQKAKDFNPMEGSIAKQYASLLYNRNAKLGRQVTEEQRKEAENAIANAYRLNPQEWQLYSFYAEYISDAEPKKALAIRQTLQRAVPTIRNAILLGNLATKLALAEHNVEQHQAYLDMAGSAYEQGFKLDPKNSDLLFNYANFYRMIGQPQKATELFTKANDPSLLWRYYAGTGDFGKAKPILDTLYKDNPKDLQLVRGELVVALSQKDADGVQKYSQALLAVDNSVDNQVLAIQSLLDSGLIAEGQKQLTAFADRNPDNATGMLLQAYVHIRKGEFKEALDLVNKCLTANPQNARAWRLKGHIDMATGKYDDSVSDFEKSKSIAPDMAVRMDLARAYLRARRSEDAITELTNTVRENDNSSEARQMLENVYINLGKKDALKKFYADTIKAFPDNVYWYSRAGAFFMGQNDYASGASLFKAGWTVSQKEQSSDPGRIGQGMSVLDGYLQAMLLAKQYDQVITYAAQYIDSAFGPVAYARMADAKAGLGNKQETLQLYVKALDKAKNNSNLLLSLLGRMANTVGQQETFAWCSEQIKSTPDSFVLNIAMSNLMQMSSEYNKALIYLDKCIEITGTKSPMYRNLIDSKQAMLISAFKKTGDKKYFDGAVDIYEKLINSSPDVETGALNNLAYLLADNNVDVDKAAGYAQKAYQSAVTNPSIVDTYAYVLYKKGDYAEAAKLAHTAVQMFEQSSVSAPGDAYMHVGMINEKLKRKAEAVAAYKQALEAKDDSLSESNKKVVQAALDRLK